MKELCFVQEIIDTRGPDLFELFEYLKMHTNKGPVFKHTRQHKINMMMMMLMMTQHIHTGWSKKSDTPVLILR